MPFAQTGVDIVLGADGFLGRNLSARLKAAGRRVTEVGRMAGDFSDCMVADRTLQAAPKADRIFHTITYQRTGQIQYAMQGELLETNARIHLNVLQSWRLHQPQAKLISMGSSCVYPESDKPLPESAFQSGPLHPSVRGYGLAKQILAVGAQSFHEQYGLRHLHCILATMYGPRMHTEPGRAHFIGGLAQRALDERRAGSPRFTVWGDPNTTRELLFVEDQIEAILAADRAFENEIINCAANIPVTIGEVAQKILQALDWGVPIFNPPESFQGTGYKILDSSRFMKKTGWVPKIDLTEGLNRCYAWLRDRQASHDSMK